MWSSAHCNGIIEEYQPSLKKRVPLIHIDSGGVLPNEVSRNSYQKQAKETLKPGKTLQREGESWWTKKETGGY